MDYRAAGPRDRLESALDQLLAALHEDLELDVFGDQVLLDDVADELVVRQRGGREAHLDLFDAYADHGLEEGQLPLRAHGVDESLVAVPEVHAAPARGGGELLGRPGPVRERERHHWPVLLVWHLRDRRSGAGHRAPFWGAGFLGVGVLLPTTKKPPGQEAQEVSASTGRVLA